LCLSYTISTCISFLLFSLLHRQSRSILFPYTTLFRSKWDFKISGQVEEPKQLTWEEFRALPPTEVTSDFHCVTRWSRLDNRWKGVLFTEVLKLVKPKPEAQFALVLAAEGYTANVPLEDLQRPNVLFAF